MSRMWWIIILVAAGIGAAVVIGVLGTRNEPSKTETLNTFCDSLTTLGGSITTLTSLPNSATKTDYENAVSAVQDDWNQVTSDAQAVQDAPTGDLDSAWDSFTAAIKDVPNDASVEEAVNDVSQSAEQLASAANTTASEVNCSSPSTTTTTSG